MPAQSSTPKRMMTYRVPTYTLDQIEELAAKLDTTKSNVVAIAIDRMYEREIAGPKWTQYLQDVMTGDDDSE